MRILDIDFDDVCIYCCSKCNALGSTYFFAVRLILERITLEAPFINMSTLKNKHNF